MDHEQQMSPHFAVFNEHINGARKKTRQFMKQWFPGMLVKVKRIAKKHGGIMGVFDEPPNESTTLYVALVTYIVNEGSHGS